MKEDEINIIGVIPARGGSKGVPRKNIRLLNGKPLIYYSIKEAKKSKFLDRIIVSTEDDEIAEIVKKFDAEVIIRPNELATDESPVMLTLEQVVTYLKEKEDYDTDIIVMLQPTTPFRKATNIDNAIKLLIETDADSVVSVCEAPHTCNPHWVRKIVNGKLHPYLDQEKDLHPLRQDLPKVYWRNGQIYAVKKDVLFETGTLYGNNCRPYIMPRKYHVNIDDELDFMLAELLIKEGKVIIEY